jgi:hypothetical protein
MEYSHEANLLLSQMPHFDREGFETWWTERQKQIGSKAILEYLYEIDRKTKNPSV